jgi:CRP/FNR family cyclic AMP-dependent transcriptional regulator
VAESNGACATCYQLESYPRYTHQQLSSMVGSNREAVTRAMGHLQREGAIEVRGRRVYARDFDTLRSSAGE